MPWLSVARAGAARDASVLLATCTIATVAAPVAHAQSTTLTFSGLTAVDASGVRYVDNCYEESGFRVALDEFACEAAATLATWTADNPVYYTGSPALYNNLPGAVVFTPVGGQTFAFQSIGLAPFLGQLGNPTTVLFTGVLAAGGTVTRSVDVPGGVFGTPATSSNYAFAGFTGLRALRFEVTSPEVEPFVQFDNVTFATGTVAVVPEPSALLLVGSGVLGVGALARRRRTR
jgi:hypothetical protein